LFITMESTTGDVSRTKRPIRIRLAVSETLKRKQTYYVVCDKIQFSREEYEMIVTTTSTLQGKEIQEYLGIVSGEVILGANVVRDFLAGITDIIGGRSGAYESKLQEGRELAIREMTEKASRLGANGIIGVDLDFETLREGMMMVIATGTAVKVK
jgi:uncharacterized protein YbjQ (UPF0145 family)